MRSAENESSRETNSAAGDIPRNVSDALSRLFEEFEFFCVRQREGEGYRLLVNALERRLIESILRRTEGNQIQAAKIMGINRNTLRAKIKKFRVDVSEYKRQGVYKNKNLRNRL